MKGFMGISNEDKIFRIIKNTSYTPDDTTNTNSFYNSSNRDLITFGELEISKLYCTTIVPNMNDTNMLIEADDIVLGKDNAKIEVLSNISFNGEAEFKFTSVFNTDAVTMADKNLALFIDQAAKIVSIVEDTENVGSYIVTVEEPRDDITIGNMISKTFICIYIIHTYAPRAQFAYVFSNPD